MRIAALAGIAPSAAVRDCYRQLDASAPDDYRQLAALLVDEWMRRGIATVGIGGGQGAGKSTLGQLIAAAAEARELRVAVLGIDDFYLARAERQRLAKEIHPLLATRGPPGTHDVALLRRTLAALQRPGVVTVPRFDNTVDVSGFGAPQEWFSFEMAGDTFVGVAAFNDGFNRVVVGRVSGDPPMLESIEVLADDREMVQDGSGNDYAMFGFSGVSVYEEPDGEMIVAVVGRLERQSPFAIGSGVTVWRRPPAPPRGVERSWPSRTSAATRVMRPARRPWRASCPHRRVPRSATRR